MKPIPYAMPRVPPPQTLYLAPTSRNTRPTRPAPTPFQSPPTALSVTAAPSESTATARPSCEPSARVRPARRPRAPPLPPAQGAGTHAQAQGSARATVPVRARCPRAPRRYPPTGHRAPSAPAPGPRPARPARTTSTADLVMAAPGRLPVATRPDPARQAPAAPIVQSCASSGRLGRINGVKAIVQRFPGRAVAVRFRRIDATLQASLDHGAHRRELRRARRRTNPVVHFPRPAHGATLRRPPCHRPRHYIGCACQILSGTLRIQARRQTGAPGAAAGPDDIDGRLARQAPAAARIRLSTSIMPSAARPLATAPARAARRPLRATTRFRAHGRRTDRRRPSPPARAPCSPERGTAACRGPLARPAHGATPRTMRRRRRRARRVGSQRVASLHDAVAHHAVEGGAVETPLPGEPHHEPDVVGSQIRA